MGVKSIDHPRLALAHAKNRKGPHRMVGPFCVLPIVLLAETDVKRYGLVARHQQGLSFSKSKE
jgi:hypothetical protein